MVHSWLSHDSRPSLISHPSLPLISLSPLTSLTLVPSQTNTMPEQPSKKRKLPNLEVDTALANGLETFYNSDGINIKPGTKDKGKSKPRGAASKWTPDESEALFHAAIKGQASYNGFENAVPGKSTKQCYDK